MDNICALDITPGFLFIGELPMLSKIGRKNGDVCIFNNETYVYVESEWERIGEPNNTNTTKRLKHPTNCKCCGAILTSNICEYCGAEYFESEVK